MTPASPMVVMGKVVAAQGLQGWLKIQVFTDYLDSLLDFTTWYVGDEGAWQPRQVTEASVHGKVLIAKLRGIADRTAAEKYKGLLVAVLREQLPPTEADEYYWSDLVGLAVESQSGDKLGVVDSLLATGANDVLVVKGGQGELLIPFIASVVLEVDMASQRIRVNWEADYLK